MNAELLLEHFHRLGDAPDAVPRLRRFILDLAVRGKLVEQNAKDEPASVLLKRLEQDTKQRTQTGEYKEPKNAIDFEVAKLPFDVPAHWCWARLIEAANVSYGFAFDSNKFNNIGKGMPLIRIRDISKTDTEAYTEEAYDPFYVVKQGDMLIGMDGDFNVRKWKGRDALLNQRVARIRDWRQGISADFMAIPIQMIVNHLHGSTSLTTVKHLSAKQLNGVYLPLPPLAEQHRIVAKVEELMALCDQLEAAQQQREQQRTRLTAATWQAVVADGSTDAARFALEQLPALTTRPEQVKALRQTILDLAVRGKLVEQDAKDEPVPNLIKRIASAREKKFKAGKAKWQQDDVPALDRYPISLPRGWGWITLREIGFISGGMTPSKARYDFWNGDIGWLSSADIKSDELFSSELKITRAGFEGTRLNLYPPGSLVMVVRSGILKHTLPVSIIRKETTVNQDLKVLQPYVPNMERYIQIMLRGLNSFIMSELVKGGTTVQSLKFDEFVSQPFPLPPLAEQHRIVAKVDELMALCDALEAALRSGEELKGRVLEAVLASGSDDQPIRRSENLASPKASRRRSGMRAGLVAQQKPAGSAQPKVAAAPMAVYAEVEDELNLAAEPAGSFTPNRGRGRPCKDAQHTASAATNIAAYLKEHPGWHAKSAVLAATGVDAAAWNAVIKALLNAGSVERQGEKKGARYRAVLA
jgi:type I restriction enzyme S subunit